MIGILLLATYISDRYRAEYEVDIDEMKLHKLLYFTQRECLVQTGMPITDASFEAWRYGPVSPYIHYMYINGRIDKPMTTSEVACYRPVFDKVFELYAPKSSWSLSTLSHGELSWQRAREGVAPDCNSSNKLSLSDIILDADRIRMRRLLFK